MRQPLRQQIQLQLKNKQLNNQHKKVLLKTQLLKNKPQFKNGSSSNPKKLYNNLFNNSSQISHNKNQINKALNRN